MKIRVSRSRASSGFTLIELLVAVGVMALMVHEIDEAFGHAGPENCGVQEGRCHAHSSVHPPGDSGKIIKPTGEGKVAPRVTAAPTGKGARNPAKRSSQTIRQGCQANIGIGLTTRERWEAMAEHKRGAKL